MSLCPSSSHQLVAAAIAFQRARRKFPKDFGLESAVERTSGSAKVEATATSRDGPINPARSSSSLAKRACNSRSDHVCPASVRSRDYDGVLSCTGENLISCSCCRARNDEDISELRDECSGGDAIDTVTSREREVFAITSRSDKNEFVKSAERDRYDVTSRTTKDKVVKRTEQIPSARSAFYHHRKARCPSRPRSNVNPVDLLYDATRKRSGKVACGDSSSDGGKDLASTSCRVRSIDLDDEAVVTVNDARDDDPLAEDAWAKPVTMAPHRQIVDPTTRCQCELYPRQEFHPDLLRSSCDRCCHRHHHRPRDCSHRHRYCQRCEKPAAANAKGRETYGRTCDGKTRHKSRRDQVRGESGRLYARHCCSKDPDIISAAREHNDDGDNDNDDNDDDDDEDDDNVAVINHKDSMCILAEKYKAGRRCRGRRREDRVRSGDRTGEDECNKSLTSEIIDQPAALESAIPREGPSVRHACRAHCESYGIAIAKTRSRGCRRDASPEIERSKTPSNETASVHRCSAPRAPCRHAF